MSLELKAELMLVEAAESSVEAREGGRVKQLGQMLGLAVVAGDRMMVMAV